MRHRAVRLFECGFFSLLLLAGDVPAFGAEVAARGKGFEIRRAEIEELMIEQKVALQAVGRSWTSEQEAQVERETLDRLIIRRILIQKASDKDRDEAKALVDRGIAEQKTRLGSAEAYRRQILKGGVKPEAFEARLLDQAVADQVVLSEWQSKISVSDEQVREFYELGIDGPARELQDLIGRMQTENRDTAFYRDATNRLEQIRQANLARLIRPEQAEVRMLVLFTKDGPTGQPLAPEIRQAKRDRIKRLRDRVRSGEPFADLAIEFSEESGAAANKGIYLATKDQIPMKALRDAVFQLPLNQVSDIIDTEIGYYLVEVLKRPPGGKVSLDEAKKDIRDLLIRQGIEKQLPAWYESLKREYEVEVTRDP